jgi:general secretion pathway protein I
MYEPQANHGRSEAGFTLIESLVGLAILSLVLASVFGSVMLALQETARAADRTSAALEARSLIDRVGIDIPLVEGTYDGKTALGGNYRLTIAQYPQAGKAMLDAFTVEADVWRARGGAPLVSLQTLRTAQALQ